MRYYYLPIICFWLLVTTSPLFAQQSNIAFTQGVDGQFLIGVDGSFDAGSSAVTTKFFNSYYTGQFLDADLKGKTFKRLKNNNNLGFDLTYRLQVAQMPDSANTWGYYAGINNVLHLDIGFTGDLFKLAFSGNKELAGQTAQLGKSSFQFLSYRQVKGGFIKKSGNNLWGMGLSFVKGESYSSARLSKGTLFTDADGLYIDLTTQLTFKQRDTSNLKFTDMPGWGMGLDFFYMAQLNEKSKLSFELTDFGFIGWNSKSVIIENDTSLHFEGLEVDNLFDLGDSLFTGFTTDSLLDTLGAHSSSGAFTSMLPGYVRVGYSNQLKEKLAFNAGLAYRFNANYFPYFYVGTDVNLGKKAVFTNRLSYGGYGRFGLGLGMKFDIGNFMLLQVQSNHIEGYLAPGSASAQGVLVNLIAHF